MNVEVVAVSCGKPTQPYYIPNKFMASIQRFGMEPTMLGAKHPWRGLMTKARLYRQWLREGRTNADVLIVCDAWDIVFAVHPEEVAGRFVQRSLPMGAPAALMFNAERNCFPLAHVQPQFDDLAERRADGSPWKYLNGGFIIGSPQNILAMFEAMKLDDIEDDYQRADGSWHNPNDQEFYTLVFLAQPVPMALDYKCELCQCYSNSTPDEFDWSGKKNIRNKITGVEPMVHHFNGGAKNDLMPRVIMHLGL